MMSNDGMKYIIKGSDGNEYGPVGQDVLIRWAETGRIAADTEVRNAMMMKWNKAGKIPFLKEVVSHVSSGEQDQSVKAKLADLFSTPEDVQKHSLTEAGKFEFVPGSTGLRFGSWLIDVAIIVAMGAGLLFVTGNLIGSSTLERDTAFTLFSVGFLSCILLYYAISIGYTAQTVGQLLCGVMVVRTDGGPVLMGRAFVFSVWLLVFGWTTILFTFCFPSKRAIQDKLSGVRAVKISTGK